MYIQNQAAAPQPMVQPMGQTMVQSMVQQPMVQQPMVHQPMVQPMAQPMMQLPVSRGDRELLYQPKLPPTFGRSAFCCIDADRIDNIGE